MHSRNPTPRPLLALPLLILLDWLVRVLDGKTPDVQIIAYCPDNVDNEASMHAHSESQAHENERDLVNIVAQGTRPAEANTLL